MMRDLESRPLAAREREVLQLLAWGLDTPSIAASLFISKFTLQHHLTSIYAKLGVRSRHQAIIRAVHVSLRNAARSAEENLARLRRLPTLPDDVPISNDDAWDIVGFAVSTSKAPSARPKLQNKLPEPALVRRPKSRNYKTNPRRP
jgi:DNA-binding CsgD family transcriptional regulator